MSVTGVIDYGMGNLHSIRKALEFVAPAERVDVSYDPDLLYKADRLILPGVGAIKHCMDELRRLELDHMLADFRRHKPLLGICLGMQALFEGSAENQGVRALGFIPGEALEFPMPRMGAPGPRLKVPHMGWNQVHQEREHPLWEGVPQDAWFYFVHSYHIQTDAPEHALGTTEYGLRFVSVAIAENVFGVQFHLEKSQRAGLALLGNFVQWDGSP